ncbi:RNA 3'-phosphate cyclase, partial [Candidatus Woesearchaeota archaeon]|nr:RNA 3'-phosphate cyclase [Candidatus Woesearchaeota archaeon]
GNYLIDLFSEYHDTESIGSGITVWAEFKNVRLGADKLGARDLSAEKVGESVAKQLLSFVEQDGAVDSWMADQLIPYLAIYGGEITTTEISNHTKTNIAVCENFLEQKFQIENNKISLKK